MKRRTTASFGLTVVAFCGALLLFSTPSFAAASADSGAFKQATSKEAAAKRSRARMLFSEAENAFSHDEFDKALGLFQKAQDTFFSESVNFNIAVCFERLNRVNEALDAYKKVQEAFTLSASTKDRASAAISRLQPPSPMEPLEEPKAKPVPTVAPSAIVPVDVVIAMPPQENPLPTLRSWGWIGATSTALGTGAATTVWIFGKGNQRDYNDASDLQQAHTFADRGDRYDMALRLSFGLALTGLATVAIDRLWRD